MKRELVARAPRRELRAPASTAPADHDDVCLLAVGDVSDHAGGPAVFHDRAISDAGDLQRLAPFVFELRFHPGTPVVVKHEWELFGFRKVDRDVEGVCAAPLVARPFSHPDLPFSPG